MIHWFIFLPLVTALIVALVKHPWAKQGTALVGSGVTVGIGVGLLFSRDPRTFTTPWLPQLGVHYSLGLDGVSHMLMLVAAFMTFLGIFYAAQRNDLTWRGNILALALVMETGLLGIFAARDLILFYVFFEGTLVPALFLLGRYGLDGRSRAAMKFGLYTVLGGLLMLASIVVTKALSGAASFQLSDMLANVGRLPLETQTWLFLGFLVAFAIKLPLFPMHAWLPDFHSENHPSGLGDLMGTLYKVGGYGLFRFALPLFPDVAQNLQPFLMFLAAVTAVYGAWIAFSCTDWKRLLAYAGVSHMGIVALGVFSLHPSGLFGAMVLLAAQGIYTGALFLMTGMLEERFVAHHELQPDHANDDSNHNRATRKALTIGHIRGLATVAPAFAGVALAIWFASIGVPGMAGFVGEFNAFLGAYQANPWMTAFGMVAVVAGAAFALTAYQKLWFETPDQNLSNLELRSGEWVVLGSVLTLLVVFGLYSAPVLPALTESVNGVAQLVGTSLVTGEVSK